MADIVSIHPSALQNPETIDRQANYAAFALLGAVPLTLMPHGHIHWAYPELACHILRCQPDDLPDNLAAYERCLIGTAARRRRKALGSLSWPGARYAISYEILTRDGSTIWVEERGRPHESTEGQITAVLKDTQAERTALNKAAYLASHDELTGAWNAARFRTNIQQLSGIADRYKRPAAVLRLQLSNLEDVNTAYGYDIGDLLLKNIYKRLRSIIRTPDHVARISGTSFGMALNEVLAEDMEDIAKRLMEVLSDEPYISPHGHLYAEFVCSATSVTDASASPDAILDQTHIALIYAKNNHQPFLLYNKDIETKELGVSERRNKRNYTPDDILRALNERRISIAYQPIVEARSRALHHYECLLRLKRLDGEITPAGEFIMAAETLGLVHLLDRRALELAGETLLRSSDIHLALNVSAATVKDSNAADDYLAALKGLGPATKRVTLELTETVALEDPTMASRFSVAARALGVSFAIDDFGSGYTTFQNLMAIEADAIKIDGSFIQDLSFTPHKQTFVRMMVDLAQTFGVKTVAEMVNSQEDADLLLRLGVDYLQGYMFGIPSAAPAWRRQN